MGRIYFSKSGANGKVATVGVVSPGATGRIAEQCSGDPACGEWKSEFAVGGCYLKILAISRWRDHADFVIARECGVRLWRDPRPGLSNNGRPH